MLQSDDTLGDDGRYRIVRVLGSGSFSTVYLARDERLGGRFVAAKEFNPTAFPDSEQEWARSTIQHEATLRARLPGHPYLADVTDYFQANEREYLVMEYVEGKTLRRAWEQQPHRRFDESQVLTWASQLIAALHFLHSHDPPIVYRDLKPENIMVRPDGRLALIDFGIARFYGEGRQSDTLNLGTPGYAAPEQYGKQQSDERTDIYALAVLLHQLLSGVDPSENPFNMPPLQEVRPDIRPQTAQAIQQAMKSDRNLRFQSARAFAGALGVSITGSLPPDSGPLPPRPQPAAEQMPWRRILITLLVIVGLGGSGFMALNLFADSDEPQPPTNATPLDQDTGERQGDVESTPVAPLALADESPTTGVGNEQEEEPTAAPAPSDTPEPADTLQPTETPTQAPSPPPTQTPTPQQLTYRDRPIVFDSTRNGGATNVFIMDWDGSNLRQLTNSGAIEEEADLSPDGHRIAYERQQGNNWYIYVMDVNGNNQQRLTAGREPDWSPDGRYLAFESPPPENIMLYDFNGGGVREIYGSSRRDRGPTWSPDGRQIAFMSEIDGAWQLFVTDVDSGQAEQITFDAISKRFPVWSPDGDLLAYNSVIGGTFHIWTVRTNGDDAQQLTNEGSNGRPAWSPDGQYIVFNSNRSGAWRIWRIDRDGSNPRQLSPEGSGDGDQRADWGAHRIGQ